MTVFKSTDGLVVGQPISPFFGAQNGVQGAGAPVIQSPNASPNSGVQQPVVAAVATGSMPSNASVSTVNGVSVGPSDPCSINELQTNGNGVTAMHGSPAPPSGGVNDQQFAAGTTAPTFIENGPTTTNNEPQPLGPVSGAVLTSNIGLQAGVFLG
jgi:hypothetical protein